MRQLKELVTGKLRAGSVAAGACAAMLGTLGCFPAGDGFVYNAYNSDLRLGAYGRDSYEDTVVVSLYQSSGGQANNFNTSKALLDLYTHHRSRGYSPPDSAELVMLNMRRRCNESPVQYHRDVCWQATNPLGIRDNQFLERALVPYYWDRSRCIAYRFSVGDGGESISRWGTVPNSYGIGGQGRCRPQ